MTEQQPKKVIPFELFMAGLSLYAITVVSLQIFLHDGTEIQRLFVYLDWIACIIFLLAFCRHVIFEKQRIKYIFTWGILDLASAVPWIPPLRYLRFLRVMRVLWLVRAKGQLTQSIQRDPSSSLLYLMLLALLYIYSGTCIGILLFEIQDPTAEIRTAGDALWFGLVTVSTVGYGGLIPVTTGARICAAILMFSGIGVFASLAGFLLEPLRRLASGSKEVTTADIAARVNELYDLLELTAANNKAKQESDDQSASDSDQDDPTSTQ